MGSTSKDVHLILYFPYIEVMIDHVETNGSKKDDLLRWLGIALAEMLCLPYDDWEKNKQTADVLDTFLKGYREKIFGATLVSVSEIKPISIRKLRLLSDGSIVVLLNKDKHVKKIHTKPSGLLT